MWGGNGGNAKLEPWRAWAFDASYTWYVDKTSYFSIAGFYKKLDSYIYTQRQVFDFTGLPIPTGSFVSAGNPNGLPLGSVIEASGILPLYTLSHEPGVGFAADAAARLPPARRNGRRCVP